MRPALRLATSNVFGRRGRTLLLVAVVALSAALIASVTTAMASLEGALTRRLAMLVGTADVRLRPSARGETLDLGLARTLAGWRGVSLVLPRLESPITLRVVRPIWKDAPDFSREIRVLSSSALASSTSEGTDAEVRPVDVLEGRLPRTDREIVVSQVLLQRLRGDSGEQWRRSSKLSQLTDRLAQGFGAPRLTQGIDLGPERATDATDAQALSRDRDAGIGDTIEAARLIGEPLRYTIVGISKSELFGGRPKAYLTLEGVQRAIGQNGVASSFDLILKDGNDPREFVNAYAGRLSELGGVQGRGMILETTEAVTSGAKRNMQNDLPFLIASGMSFFCAAFIITTGMTVNVIERRRELAILRCVGASRAQVAEAQIWSGLGIGLVGTAIGIPTGVQLAYWVIRYFEGTLKIEVHLPGHRLWVAAGAAIGASLLGAIWPAILAARTSPLKGLATRANVPKPRGVLLCSIVGLALVVLHALSFRWNFRTDELISFYIRAALPAMLIGYFLLGVPVILVVAKTLSRSVGAIMGVSPLLLARSIGATPYRSGLTAGAMMTGLALLVAIWTQGRAIRRDWLDRIQFPEVFVTGLSLKPRHQEALRALPFVTDTVAISLHAVETDAFDNAVLSIDRTTFIAFEPEPFFRLSRLDWVEGDEATATARLNEGGAILVAREFLAARGLGVGKKLTLKLHGRSAEYEIVGVISSPGLDIINQYFDIGEAFAETAVHAVFGTRNDLRDRLLGSEPTIQLVQVGLKPEGVPGAVGDDEAERLIREAVQDAGILDVGNGRKLKADVSGMVERSELVVSSIALMSMLVACLGVANMIVAGIDARQFEFGVMRAIGASRGAVLRLVLAEAVIVAVAACIVGTGMGIQAVWAGQKIDALIVGIVLSPRPPWGAVTVGWGIVLVVTVGAALPAVLSLGRRRPRELLAATRG